MFNFTVCNYPFNKNLFPMFFMMVLVLSIFFSVQALDSQTQSHTNAMPELPPPQTPSKGVVIAVLSIMFALTFLLLAYVKFCRVSPLEILTQNPSRQNFQGQTRSGSRFSGLDRQVIETLPFFKFSSLKGSKEGLECTVCLSKFEDSEILRLLPKCKHAFHMNCIDKWLENHSSCCPLCRCRVEAGDIKNFTCSISTRFLRVPSNLTEDPNVEIFVQREPSHRGSSRFNIGSGFWDVDKCKKEEFLIDEEGNSSGTNWKPLHKLDHKIVISDVVTRNRWSDLNSSDLLSLNSEMLNDMSSARFSLHGNSSRPFASEEEENSFTAVNPAEKRSMSEIANVPRFAEISKLQNRTRESVVSNGREERLRRIWLPIARRTVQWFARQERNSVELEHKPLASNV